jgi:sugar (pentulose or hexulose) kinase
MTAPGHIVQGDLVLGIDASTTACKAIAFDARGRSVAEGRGTVPLDNPEPDGWEQDPESWWRALCQACGQVSEQLAGSERIAAMCITHQRETVVALDKASAQPIHPALVWMDKRCGAQVRALRERGDVDVDEIHAVTGKPVCTTPSIYKLMYLFDRLGDPSEPPWLLDVHAYLVGRLTDARQTSLASADPMGMIDMTAGSWASEIIDKLLPPVTLPSLSAPGELIAGLTEEAARATSLHAGLPLIAGAGDGQCAGLGAGITEPGRAYLNLGTAVVSGVLSNQYRTDVAFRTLYGAAPDTYFLETDLQGGCFTINWLIERLLGRGAGAESDALLAQLDTQARQLSPGAEGLMLVPYFNGVMNPYWDDDAGGMMVGLRGHHQAGHMFRAILEGIAFEQRLHMEGVERAAGKINELVVMGGGSKSELWCQIMADVTRTPVVRAGSSEATALGAGMLAAVHADLHSDLLAASEAMTSTGARFEPADDAARYDALYSEVYRSLYPSMATSMQKLVRLTSPPTPKGQRNT